MFHDLAYRIRALFNQKDLEKEMDDELQFHFEREVEKQIQAGLSREEAARRVRLTFGGIEQTREECRQARGVALVEGLLRDVSHALRGFRRSPGFTATVIFSLALGIGANTAIFTLINVAMLKSLPVSHPEDLVMLTQSGGTLKDPEVFSQALWEQIRDHQDVFSGMCVYGATGPPISVRAAKRARSGSAS